MPQPRSPREAQVLAKLRALCLSLPGTTETSSWGHPNFRAGGRIYAALERARGHLTIAFRATPLEQGILLQDSRFFVPPYAGQGGWVSLIADGRIAWKKVGALIEASYRMAMAPRPAQKRPPAGRSSRNPRGVRRSS